MTFYDLILASLEYLPVVSPIFLALGAVAFAELITSFLFKLLRKARQGMHIE